MLIETSELTDANVALHICLEDLYVVNPESEQTKEGLRSYLEGKWIKIESIREISHQGGVVGECAFYDALPYKLSLIAPQDLEGEIERLENLHNAIEQALGEIGETKELLAEQLTPHVVLDVDGAGSRKTSEIINRLMDSKPGNKS